MGTNFDKSSSRIHLESINCEIFDIKSSLIGVLNKVDCHISFFVSFKEKFCILTGCHEQMNLFEDFLVELKQEVLKTDTKVSLLEESVKHLSQLLHEREIMNNEENMLELKSEQSDGEGKLIIDENGSDIGDSPSETFEEQELKSKIESVEVSDTMLLNDTEPCLKHEEFEYFQTASNISKATVKLKKCDAIRFQCVVCFKIFTSKQSFMKHEDKHKKDFPISCDMCGLRVRNETLLKEHKTQTHQEYELKCYICNKVCASSLNLLSHIKNNHTQYLVCPICDRKFTNIRVLESHHSQHNVGRDKKCEFCEKQFVKKNHLLEHVFEKHLKNRNSSETENFGIINRHDVDKKSDVNKEEIKSAYESNASDSLTINDVHDNSNNSLMLVEVDTNQLTRMKTSYKCKECFKKHPNFNKLLMHILEEHSLNYFLKYQCKICSKTFAETKLLKKHKKREHKKDCPHRCQRCDKTFALEDDLKSHMQCTHEKDTSIINDKDSSSIGYKCHFCDQMYESAGGLQRHKRVHSEDLYECPLCEKGYKDSSELRKHIYVHILMNLKCTYCDQAFEDRNQLAAHMKENHDFKLPLGFLKRYSLKVKTHIKPNHINNSKEHAISTNLACNFRKLSCQMCSESFLSRDCYLKHRKTHTVSELKTLTIDNKSDSSLVLESEKINQSDGSTAYKCLICGKTFSARDFADRHLISHSGDRPYQCETCELRYTDSSSLRKHVLSTHPDADGNLSCSKCLKKFDSITSLTEHRRTHVPERPAQCIACGRCFSSKSNMRQHVCSAITDKEKGFTCEICFRKYRTNFQLKVHMRTIHINSKSKVCEYCGAAFSQKCNLDKHRYSHTGGKPLNHQCPTCKKSFRDSNYLKQHMNIHAGKRFSCEKCGNTFAYARGLKRHLKETCNKLNESSVLS